MEYKEKIQNKIYKFAFLEDEMTAELLLRAVALIVVVALLGTLVCLPVGAGDKDDNTIRVLYRVREAEDGILELEISLDSKMGMCAALCVLNYNPDSLIYLSGGAPDDSVSFTAVDFGGELRFLLDSRQNTAPNCVLACLYFKKTGEGKRGFSLKCRDMRYLGGKGEILSAEAFVVADMPSDDAESGEKREEYAPPQLAFWNVNERGISFEVKARRGCFAAGVRLFFVDLGGAGEHFEILIVGVVTSDGVFSGEYRFCPESRYAVSVTALCYDRLGVCCGERATAIVPFQN